MKNLNNLLWLILSLTIACSRTENVMDVGQDLHDTIDFPPEKGSLIDQQVWEQTPLTNDPFSPPENASCDPTSGIGTESLDGEPTIAILTDFCPWATVAQSTLLNLNEGDNLNFRIWHFELTGEGPAHILIRIGNWTAVDRQIEKPHKAQLLADTIRVPNSIASGSKVYFHVDNHGANEYSLVELSKN